MLDAQADIPADESEGAVRAQNSWEKACLAEDLEAVADPEHRPALTREGRYGGHDGSEPGDGAAAEVVTVGEPPGQYDAVDRRQRRLAVPDQHGLCPEAVEREGGVAVVVRAGKDEYGDARSRIAHADAGVPTSTSKLSMSGLASSRRHMSSACARASS